MTKTMIQTEQAPAPVGPYSQAIAATGTMVFVAGQIPLDPQTGEVNRGSIAEQTRLALTNLQAVVQAAGATLEAVVKTSVFLADMNEFTEMNAVYAEFFNSNAPPARACVEVARLPKDVRVEVECIAVISQ